MILENIDDLTTLSVTDCKRMGFFVPNALAKGAVKWTKRGTTCAEVLFATDLRGEPTAYLAYSYNGETREYKIGLRWHTSNLNDKHGYFYFVCPKTGKSCRKLYLVEGEFVSRSETKTIYHQQGLSHNQRRGFIAYLDVLNKIETAEGQKYRRTTYRGKPTPYGRRLQRLDDKYWRFQQAFAAYERGDTRHP